MTDKAGDLGGSDTAMGSVSTKYSKTEELVLALPFSGFGIIGSNDV